jgi:hypothetical protein
MRRPTITQYNVQFQNTTGMLAKLTRLLVREKIDFKSVITTSVDGKTAIQFLASKDAALREKLEKTGAVVQEDLIFQLELPNHHWELHKLAKTLAEKDINIVSLYSTIEGDNMRIILAVDQPANAVALVEKLGFDPDYSLYEDAALI